LWKDENVELTCLEDKIRADLHQCLVDKSKKALYNII